MGYKGRIVSISFMLAGILVARLYAYMYLDYSLSHLPYLGLLFLFAAYKAGKQYDKVVSLSIRDPLTGCYNRQFMDHYIPSALVNMDRHKVNLGLAVLDCNHFKVINDTYGHKKGDMVLQELSAILKKRMRKQDRVIRWGGDEFLLLVPGVDRAGMRKLLWHLDQDLQEASKRLQVTLSVSRGFAMYPEDARDFDELLHVADQKMFDKKRSWHKKVLHG